MNEMEKDADHQETEIPMDEAKTENDGMDDADCYDDDGVDIWEHAVTFAPHMTRNGIVRLVEAAMKEGAPTVATVKKLAPFLPGEMIDDLVFRAVESRIHHTGERVRSGSRWPDDARDIFETVQREVANAAKVGQESLLHAKESLKNALDWLLNQDD